MCNCNNIFQCILCVLDICHGQYIQINKTLSQTTFYHMVHSIVVGVFWWKHKNPMQSIINNALTVAYIIVMQYKTIMFWLHVMHLLILQKQQPLRIVLCISLLLMVCLLWLRIISWDDEYGIIILVGII